MNEQAFPFLTSVLPVVVVVVWGGKCYGWGGGGGGRTDLLCHPAVHILGDVARHEVDGCGADDITAERRVVLESITRAILKEPAEKIHVCECVSGEATPPPHRCSEQKFNIRCAQIGGGGGVIQWETGWWVGGCSVSEREV